MTIRLAIIARKESQTRAGDDAAPHASRAAAAAARLPQIPTDCLIRSLPGSTTNFVVAPFFTTVIS
jgi:hypothetical protein